MITIDITNPPLPNGCIIFTCRRAPLECRDGTWYCTNCDRDYGNGTGKVVDWDAVIEENSKRKVAFVWPKYDG
jgi:hypothetical protein